MRNYAITAALTMVMLSTSGCDRQASGQTVAVVNGEEISSAELNAELAMANIPETVDKKTVMPQLLQRVVDRRLVAQHAAEQGLDRTPEYLTKQRRLNEELLINQFMERQASAIKAPDQATIDRYMAANPGMFGERAILVLDQIAFEMPADVSLLQQMGDDHSLDEVAATLDSLGIAYIRRAGRLDTASAPAQMMEQINALPPGEPFIVPSGAQAVASVITGREPVQFSQEQLRRNAAEALRRQQLGEVMNKQLEQLRAAAEVEYQEGYGAPAKSKAPAESAAAQKGK